MDLPIATERLVLRAPTVADAEAFWPYVSNPELPYYMTWEAHRDLAETNAFLQYCQDSSAQGSTATWAMFEPSGPELGSPAPAPSVRAARSRAAPARASTPVGGALVGLVGLHDITRQVRAWRRDVAELGYWTAPHAQGRGYVTEAARAVVDVGFTRLGLHKVTVGCLAENLASKRVIEKLGFRYVGVERDHAFRHGRWWDHLAYEITAPEWAARARA